MNSINQNEIELLKTAKWIGIDRRFCSSVVMFHKKFTIPTNTKSIELYIVSTGLMRILFNKKCISQPVVMCNHKSELLSAFSYRLENFTTDHDNLLSVQVAQSWSLSSLSFDNNHYDRYALLAMLKVTDSHGNIILIPSDESWSASNCEIISCEYNKGETIDFRQEKYYINAPAGTTLENIFLPNYNKNNIISFNGFVYYPINKIHPVSIDILPSGKKIIDFGQTITGYVEISVSKNTGDKIRFVHLTDRSDLNNNKKIQSTYFLSKKENQLCTPRFSVMKFRYIVFEEYPLDNIDISSIVAVQIGPLYSYETSINCSLTPDLNSYYSVLKNHLGTYITDTTINSPESFLTRIFEESLYCKNIFLHFDCRPFYSKWLWSILHSNTHFNSEFSFATACFLLIILWNYYSVYNDISIIEYYYSYIALPLLHLNNNKIYDFFSLIKFKTYQTQDYTNSKILSNAFYINALYYAHKISSILQKESDSKFFSTLYISEKTAFQKEFIYNIPFNQFTIMELMTILFCNLSDRPKDTIQYFISESADIQISKNLIYSTMLPHILFRHLDEQYALKILFGTKKYQLTKYFPYTEILIEHIFNIKKSVSTNHLSELIISPNLYKQIGSADILFNNDNRPISFKFKKVGKKTKFSITIPENVNASFKIYDIDKKLETGNNEFFIE